MLIGTLAPDAGRLRLGSNVEPLYFDQRRESLDTEATLWQVLETAGGDSILVHGRQPHVVSYLKATLFAERLARQPSSAMPGGATARRREQRRRGQKCVS